MTSTELQVFGTASFTPTSQATPTPSLDVTLQRLEIVDLGPASLETMAESVLDVSLRLHLLRDLQIKLDQLVLKLATAVKNYPLGLAAVTAERPANPAVEQSDLRARITKEDTP